MGSEADLAAARIEQALQTVALGRSLEVWGKTASSNDLAKQAAERGAPHGHTIVTDAQTQGRGSHGRLWSSPPDTNLYLSVVIRTPLPPAQIAPLTLVCGLAVAETVDHFVPGTSSIKWPNDVYLNQKKCAGLLLEASSQGGATVGALIIGIGLNVNRAHFDDDLDTQATSMHLSDPELRTFDRARVLALLLRRLEAYLDMTLKIGVSPLLEEVRKRLMWRDQWVRCGESEGVFLNISHDGALILERSGKRQHIYAGRLETCSMPQGE